MGDASTPSKRLTAALRDLTGELRDRLAARTGSFGKEAVELSVRLPIPLSPDALERLAADVHVQLEREVEALVVRRSLCHPGHVYCLRCCSSTCEHSAPVDPRHVFVGYGSTGLPSFQDFGQLLLERQHPEIHRLYEHPPRFLALALDARELTREASPAYRDQQAAVRLYGAVAAGWYRVPIAGGEDQRSAATFLVLSTGRGRRRRFALQVVGELARPSTADALFSRHGRLPWADASRWAEEVLQQVEKSVRSRRPPGGARVQRRLDGMLRQLADGLQRPERGRHRRTAHGEERHRSGHRPTPAALGDLIAAPLERLLIDCRHETVIVLGPKGRTHVFREDGKLVTSVRYETSTIARRQKNGQWRPATMDEADRLRGRARALIEAG